MGRHTSAFACPVCYNSSPAALNLCRLGGLSQNVHPHVQTWGPVSEPGYAAILEAQLLCRRVGATQNGVPVREATPLGDDSNMRLGKLEGGVQVLLCCCCCGVFGRMQCRRLRLKQSHGTLLGLQRLAVFKGQVEKGALDHGQGLGPPCIQQVLRPCEGLGVEGERTGSAAVRIPCELVHEDDACKAIVWCFNPGVIPPFCNSLQVAGEVFLDVLVHLSAPLKPQFAFLWRKECVLLRSKVRTKPILQYRLCPWMYLNRRHFQGGRGLVGLRLTVCRCRYDKFGSRSARVMVAQGVMRV
mmetsp:Transcript_6973/g.15357  ORF Transcript_6973/g.15357 Transcript_6973/m.15357 type:complete len:299 (+) Transcript_6973:398-1294(+)